MGIKGQVFSKSTPISQRQHRLSHIIYKQLGRVNEKRFPKLLAAIKKDWSTSSYSCRLSHMAFSGPVQSRRKESRSPCPALPPPSNTRVTDTTSLCVRWAKQTAIQARPQCCTASGGIGLPCQGSSAQASWITISYSSAFLTISLRDLVLKRATRSFYFASFFWFSTQPSSSTLFALEFYWRQLLQIGGMFVLLPIHGPGIAMTLSVWYREQRVFRRSMKSESWLWDWGKKSLWRSVITERQRQRSSSKHLLEHIQVLQMRNGGSWC